MAKTTELVEVAIEKLVPYERNAKQHPIMQLEQIRKSIEEFGFVSPCLIDRNNNIIAGHGRVQAAKALGMKTVPCVYIEGLSEDQRRAYIIADNRLTELGGWDDNLLNEEMEYLNSMDFDVSLTGFELTIDIPALGGEIQEDDDFDYETPDVPISNLGDIWQLGDHRLICGDSTDPNVHARLMDGRKADMVFTDPPWNVSYGESDHPTWKKRTILNDSMSEDDFFDFMDRSFRCMNESCKPGAMVYVVMSAQEWGNLMPAMEENGFHWSSTIIWNKDKFVLSRKDYHTKYEPIWYGWKDGAARLCPLNDRTLSDVWDFDRPIRSDEHPTMKPVPLVAHAIENSCKIGGLVLDQFGGSGTTLIAAEETGRVCYMAELDPKYCDVIVRRWEELTGREGVLVDGK